MGKLTYGVAPAVVVSDWGLRHLHAVINAKLRRNESFLFCWDDNPGIDDVQAPVATSRRHGAVWISKSSALHFRFDGPLDRPLNRAWLEALASAASSNTGLRLVPEPAGPAAPSRPREAARWAG